MTPAVYTIRSLRANLRAAIAAARESGAPAIIAERGERPVAVLVDYASWAAQHGESSDVDAVVVVDADLAAAPQRATSQCKTRPSEERAQPSQGAAPSLSAGWGAESAPPRPGSDGQSSIPAGWRAEKSGWGI